MPRCPNGSRRNKKTGNCEKKIPKSVTQKKKISFPPLTVSDIETILNEFNIEDANDKHMITKKLKKMKYDPTYQSCWDGKPGRDLYSQAREKVSCWAKYGDKL